MRFSIVFAAGDIIFISHADDCFLQSLALSLITNTKLQIFLLLFVQEEFTMFSVASPRHCTCSLNFYFSLGHSELLEGSGCFGR